MVMTLLILFIEILMTVGGQYKIKIAQSFFGPDFIIGCVLYVLSFALWIYLLKNNPLSVIIPLAVALTIVMSLIVGVVFLKESVNLIQIIGIVLIIGGVSLVSIYKI